MTSNSKELESYNNLKEEKGEDASYNSQLGDNEEEYKGKDYKIWQIINKLIIKVLATVMNFIVCCVLVYPLFILLSLFSIFQAITKKQFKNLLITIVVLISSLSTIYMLYMTIQLYNKDTPEKYWFFDAFIFFLSSMLVVSYIKVVHQLYDTEKNNKQPELNSLLDVFSFLKLINMKLIQTIFNVSIEGKADDGSYTFSLTSSTNIRVSTLYKEVMEDIQLSSSSQKFNYFKIQANPFHCQHEGHSILSQKSLFRKEIWYFITLLVVILIKAFMIIAYLFHQGQSFDSEQLINIGITAMYYGYTTFILNNVLGSYDLQAKTRMMNQLNQIIDFRSEDSKKKHLLDITSPQSIETWDNTRKFVCQLFQEKLQSLEWAYICFFFYYIFVTLIIIAAYGEFYWIASKDSVYMQPLMVIQYTVDFIFLNLIFLFRIWEGQKYNDTFEEIVQNINYLLDVTEDMQSMYDNYFDQSRQVSTSLVQEDNVYSKITERIKYISQEYISKGALYLGIQYRQDQIHHLQKKILKNINSSLNRVKSSNSQDQSECSYRFLNFFQVQFAETITTVVLALLSFLPNVIPKLIEMFQIQKPE